MPHRRSAESLREVALRLTRHEVMIKVDPRASAPKHASSAPKHTRLENLRFISHNLELTCCGHGVAATIR